jgi:Na+(H+)/acetate symporter ActP
MTYLLIGLISLVVLFLLVLRTNTAVVFLAVCAGTVLLKAAGTETDLLARSFSSGANISSNLVQASVILMPALISALVLRKRIPKSKILFAVLPAFCTAVVALTLVYPFLTSSFQTNLANSEGWSLIAQYYQLIVVVGVVSSIVTLAVTIPKPHGSKHKKGKH